MQQAHTPNNIKKRTLKSEDNSVKITEKKHAW